MKKEIIDAEVVVRESITIEDAIVVSNPQATGLDKYGVLAAMIDTYDRTYSVLVPDDLVIETDAEKAKIRDLRIEINKINNENKEKLRDKKNEIVKQIDEAIKIYNEEASPVLDKYYQNAAKAISDYDEKGIKDKTAELETFLDELLVDTGIDFVTFADLNISVTASKAITALRRDTEAQANVIITNFNSIQMMNDSDRILEEYKKDLDLNKAIETIRRENEIAERLAQQKIDDERRAQEAAHAKAIKEAEEKAAKEAEERVRAELAANPPVEQPTPQPTNNAFQEYGQTMEQAAQNFTNNFNNINGYNENQLNRYRFDVLATSEDMKKVLEVLAEMKIGVKTELITEPAKIEDIF